MNLSNLKEDATKLQTLISLVASSMEGEEKIKFLQSVQLKFQSWLDEIDKAILLLDQLLDRDKHKMN